MKIHSAFLILISLLLFVSCGRKTKSDASSPLAKATAIWSDTDSKIASEELVEQLLASDDFKVLADNDDAVLLIMGEVSKSKDVDFHIGDFTADMKDELESRRIRVKQKTETDQTDTPNDEVYDQATAIITTTVKTNKGGRGKEKYIEYEIKLNLRNPLTFVTITTAEIKVKKYKN